MSRLDGVTVLFEAGNRFGALVEELQRLLPDREVCLCREVTKTYQEIVRKPIVDIAVENVLGEVTLVIGPGEAVEQEDNSDGGIKAIAEKVGKEWNISKREAYNLLMKIKP